MKVNTVTVRLTDELYTELLIKSRSLNMTNSDYLRNSIMNTKINYQTNDIDYGYLIGAVNKIGNNINQIAHNLNIARNQKELNNQDYDDLLNQLLIINSNMKSLI